MYIHKQENSAQSVVHWRRYRYVVAVCNYDNHTENKNDICLTHIVRRKWRVFLQTAQLYADNILTFRSSLLV